MLRKLFIEDVDSVFSSLFDGRIDKSKYEKLLKIDPTFRSRKSTGNYGKWIINSYIKSTNQRGFNEDLDKLSSFLKVFDKVKNKLDKNDRDLNKLKEIKKGGRIISVIEQLGVLVEDYLPKSGSAAKTGKFSYPEVGKAIKNNEYEEVYKDSNWRIVDLKTRNSAIVFGHEYTSEAGNVIGTGKTKWCTANPTGTYYDSSYKNDRIIVVFNNKKKRKWQFDFDASSIQLMDENDKQINFSKWVNDWDVVDNKGLSKVLLEYSKKTKYGMMLKNPDDMTIYDIISVYNIRDYSVNEKTKEITINGNYVYDGGF